MAESYYIAKVFRQHNSQVVTIPLPVCTALGIKPGNHVVFTWNKRSCEFDFAKFKPVGAQDERTRTDTDRTDKGG
ncbi:hypothetical protein LCGC14_1164400 [marine sediment metagenome]|uniref:SpoVT-AbrB domain-containing protein n=1 Tax=marine sediment metagenome TaxID=412755 RepID=A0A0F9PXB3_9ZZZZ